MVQQIQRRAMRRQDRLRQVEVPHRRADVPVAEQALDGVEVRHPFQVDAWQTRSEGYGCRLAW